MYLHLGGDVLIKKEDIIAIIDLEMMKVNQNNRIFLSKIKNQHKNIFYISEPGREKTLIVTINDLYFSPISSVTLFKRSAFDFTKNLKN